jgi:hypothetical protein
MDIPQLKLLAGRVRGLLDQHDVAIGHSQALDLIAALPGLRNWPEVGAFPDRVATCELTSTTAARLAHRLRSKHGVEFSPQSLVDALTPPDAPKLSGRIAPTIWPSGPAPGVYVTTSQAAIDALLQRYDDATDGELVYAEDAGSGWEGAIDLGEHGLSSKGLARVSSGTLLVIGPLELNQGAWDSSAHKLEWACLRAQCDHHRVAVLIDTPQPEFMFKDIEIAVRQVAPEGDDCHLALTGIVTDDGELVPRAPFVQPVAAPVVKTVDAPTDALPPRVIELLEARLQQRRTGFIILSSCVWEEHWGIEQIAAALPLTEAVGPVARIKPRNRSTPAKDTMVPDIVKALPFLSSVESAYAHGYRRMLVSPSYTDFRDLLNYTDDVLFFVGSHSLEVEEALMETVRFRGFGDLEKVYERLVACIGIGPISVGDQIVRIADLFVPGSKALPAGADFEAITKHVRKNRVIRWEDELTQLLDSGVVTPDLAKASLERRRGKTIEAFLAKWVKRKQATTA